jgi:flagellum-specific peptidoglycan hydrolase FlgJ
MAKTPSKPPKGLKVAGILGNSKYYYAKDGLIVDEQGRPVSDRIIAAFDTSPVGVGQEPRLNPTPPSPTQPTPSVAPAAAAKPASESQAKEDKDNGSDIGNFVKKLGRDKLKSMFPEYFYLKEMWENASKEDKEDKEKTKSELKRAEEDKKRKYEQIIDILQDSNESLTEIVAVQQETSTILGKVTEALASSGLLKGTGGGLLDNLIGGNKGSSVGRNIADGAKKIGYGKIGAAAALAAGAGALYYYENNKKEEETPAAAPTTPPPPSGSGTTPAMSTAGSTTPPTTTAGGTSVAEKNESTKIKEAKKHKAEDVLRFSADDIIFKADQLSFNVKKLTVTSTIQGQSAAAQGGVNTGLGTGITTGGQTQFNGPSSFGTGTGPSVSNNPNANQNLPSQVDQGKIQQQGQPQTMQLQNAPITPAAGYGKKPTGSQKEYYDKMYASLYQAAKAKGLPNPEVVAQLGATQTSLETGYGQHMVGNNAFGIKAKAGMASVSAGTQEFENGRMVNKPQRFRRYNDVTESASDYIDFLMKNKKYKGVLAATNINDAIIAQGRTGYATDPNYTAKLAAINAKFGGQAPPEVVQQAMKEKTPEAAVAAVTKSTATASKVPDVLAKTQTGPRTDGVEGVDYEIKRAGRSSYRSYFTADQIAAKNQAKNATIKPTYSPSNFKSVAEEKEYHKTVNAVLSGDEEAGYTTKSGSYLADVGRSGGGGQFEENYSADQYKKPAPKPSPKAHHEAAKKPHEKRLESSSPASMDPGGNMIFRLALLLPFLAMTQVTGHHQAAHSIMQNRRRR